VGKIAATQRRFFAAADSSKVLSKLHDWHTFKCSVRVIAGALHMGSPNNALRAAGCCIEAGPGMETGLPRAAAESNGLAAGGCSRLDGPSVAHATYALGRIA